MTFLPGRKLSCKRALRTAQHFPVHVKESQHQAEIKQGFQWKFLKGNPGPEELKVDLTW